MIKSFRNILVFSLYALHIPSFCQVIETDHYHLLKTSTNPRAVLILFGGYPEDASRIRREFKIEKAASQSNVSVAFMNYNRKLWMIEDELKALSSQLSTMLRENNLPDGNIYIGGFSSGGNVSFLVSNYLIKNSLLNPKGVFLVDSPIDLLGLYRSAEKNVERNFSSVSVEESSWLIHAFNHAFGNPLESTSKYEQHSIFTLVTNSWNNISELSETKLRFYTEPDSIWWKENRMAEYSQTNAFYIEKLSETLQNNGLKNVEYIPTTDKGYRSNGDRHPHSWSIVDVDDLLKWMLED